MTMFSMSWTFRIEADAADVVACSPMTRRCPPTFWFAFAIAARAARASPPARGGDRGPRSTWYCFVSPP